MSCSFNSSIISMIRFFIREFTKYSIFCFCCTKSNNCLELWTPDKNILQRRWQNQFKSWLLVWNGLHVESKNHWTSWRHYRTWASVVYLEIRWDYWCWFLETVVRNISLPQNMIAWVDCKKFHTAARHMSDYDGWSFWNRYNYINEGWTVKRGFVLIAGIKYDMWNAIDFWSLSERFFSN